MPSENPYLHQEYTARINRVIDYIEDHLDQDLSLELIAGVANFSPYHFHRIFRGMVGETVHQFTQRVRVEKAAALLLYQPKKTITEIALDCGFSGSATFARAFREAFGMSATAWRRGGYHSFSNFRKTDSKIRQTMGKMGKTSHPQVRYLADEFGKQKWTVMISNQLTAQVEVRDLPDLHIAYIRHIGPYQGDEGVFEKAFAKLMKWAGPRGLIRFPETQMLSVYHDAPDITEPEKLRTSIGITVPPDTEVEGEVGKMTIPGGQYAIARFELDATEYAAAWDAVYGSWLPDSGYQPADSPPLEIYHSSPEHHPEGKHVVDICVPVKPL